MGEFPLISIALCTYNGATFLEEQLNSVVSQSYSNLEIIIVDDCSSDETVKVINQFLISDKRISLVINHENLGYNRNFEKALKLCSGEYIAICDQDDIWYKDKIKKQLEAIRNYALIYHDSEFTDQYGKTLKFRISDKFNFYRGSDPTVFLYLNCVSGHSIFLRKSLLATSFPFPTGFHYDQWLAFVAANQGSIGFLPECLVRYRQHDANTTDILAKKTTRKKSENDKGLKLQKESEWLKLCSDKANDRYKNHINNLYNLSLGRNKSIASVAYGFEIWKNKNSLLCLLKKNNLSKFFYVVRKIWGKPMKNLSINKFEA